MPARFRVALQGFSEFERSALAFCFRHAATREPAYVQVDEVADSDFIVAEAIQGVPDGSPVRGERLRDTLFVGGEAPAGAGAHVGRPIDPERILRALDAMADGRAQIDLIRPGSLSFVRVLDLMADGKHPRTAAPDISLPLTPTEPRYPALDENEIVDTAPAAFHHEALAPAIADPEPIAEPPLLAPAEPVAEPPLLAPAEPVAEPQAIAVPAPAEPIVAEVAAPPPLPPVDKKIPMTEAERAAAKAAARRRSRRARLAQAVANNPNPPRDVLLLDGTPQPSALSVVLEAFGFQVHRAAGTAQAMSVLEQVALAAAFVDAAPLNPGDIDGLDLCLQIKQRQFPLAGTPPPVMLLASRDSAAGRVRAKLAGCDAVLIRPVSRGDAARALEACDVALPADARKASEPR